MFVEVHAGFRGNVLGTDDLTVSLKGLQLEEFGCREELEGDSKATQNEAHGSGLEMLINLWLSGIWFNLSYLHDFCVAYVQRLAASAIQILHDQLKHRA